MLSCVTCGSRDHLLGLPAMGQHLGVGIMWRGAGVPVMHGVRQHAMCAGCSSGACQQDLLAHT